MTPGIDPAAAPAQPQRMARKYRRLVLVGCLAALAGVVLGQFVFGGIVLAAAGLALVAVALSNNGGRGGRQPLLWAAAALGLGWVTVVGLYWWQLSLRVDLARRGLPTGPADATDQRWEGAGAAVAVALLAVVILASILRARSRPAA